MKKMISICLTIFVCLFMVLNYASPSSSPTSSSSNSSSSSSSSSSSNSSSNSSSSSNTNTYNYDNLGRLTSVTYESEQPVEYSYDAGGNLLSSSYVQSGDLNRDGKINAQDIVLSGSKQSHDESGIANTHNLTDWGGSL